MLHSSKSTSLAKYIIISFMTKCLRERWNGFVGQIWPKSHSMETLV